MVNNEPEGPIGAFRFFAAKLACGKSAALFRIVAIIEKISKWVGTTNGS